MVRIVLVSALVVLTVSCKKPQEGEGASKEVVVPAVKVETGEVQAQPMPKYLTLTGSIFADRESEVAANVAGRVASVYVERGQPVKKGQTLAVVDSKAANYQAMAATAQSQAADTQVELAKQDCARADTLFSQGALPQAEYDRQKTQCTAQLYNANAARAQADLAGKLAGDTVIRAPIDGSIGERFVNVGEYLQPSSKVASIYAIDPVRVNISVPESAVSKVKEGQTLMLRVSAYPGRDFPASVRFVSAALRPNTRDLIVEAFAENKDAALRPGMFATVLLNVGEEEQITVPKEAIKIDGTVRRMFLAKEGAAHEMVVRTGVEKAGRIAVLENLTAGDSVVLNPPPGLRDASKIQ